MSVAAVAPATRPQHAALLRYVHAQYCLPLEKHENAPSRILWHRRATGPAARLSPPPDCQYRARERNALLIICGAAVAAPWQRRKCVGAAPTARPIRRGCSARAGNPAPIAAPAGIKLARRRAGVVVESDVMVVRVDDVGRTLGRAETRWARRAFQLLSFKYG